LDNAIVAEDQVARGATADYESSFSSIQSSIQAGDSSLKGRMDEQKVAELYRLIEGGDWEGIVIHADPKLSRNDKSLDVSISSDQQDSQGSASGAILVDEPKAAELHRLIERGDWKGVIRAASTFESDGKSSGGSLSHPGSRGFSFGAESSHLSIASSSVEGSAIGSTTGSGITPRTFQSSTLTTGTSKNRDRAELSRQVEELFQLYTLVDGRVTEGAIRAASTFSRDDKSLDGSILSHLGSPGSASGAVLEDEPQAAELHRLIQVGDWEGVRRAATAFSSDSKSLDGSLLSRLGSPRSASGAESSHRSIASASIEGSASRSTTGPGTTPHTFTSSTPSTGTSTNRDRAGLRRNVEELIHRMAPEETEHVDETMLQFKGREDELLETLRTMQERLIAHKARATTNKQVKLKTKK
jgi:anti-sigma28 factor (negative regulator of flagellin synthesis)